MRHSDYPDGRKAEEVEEVIPFDRQVAAALAKVMAGVTFIMTYVWASKKEDTYLGGLDWDDQSKVFNWHPTLMVLGMLFFFGCGITSFKNMGMSKPVNKFLHVTCYVGSIVSFSVGLKAVWKSHDNLEGDVYFPNLYSMHSWLGLGVVVLFGQNFFLGLYHFIVPAVSQDQKKAYMDKHVFLGLCTLVIAVVAIETGIVEKNGFVGCSYSVDSKDTNPAEHYKDIPEGCRLSNGIGIMTIATLFVILYALWPGRPKDNQDGIRESLAGSRA